MNLSRNDLVNLALLTSAGATEAYADDRLATSSTYHHLAARLWAEAACPKKAAHHSALAQAVDNEAIAIAAGDVEEAEYIASTLRAREAV